MIKEYLNSLEKNYGYTGNWQPNCSLQVGNWADVELGFLPWLKELVGIHFKSLEINENLHSIMAGSLGDLNLKKEKMAPMTLYHNVSINAGGSCQPVSIKAQKKGGFFAVFQDIYAQRADPVLFKDKLEKLNKTSIAVVSGVMSVKKGFLVVFNKNSASITLSGDCSLDTLINHPAALHSNLDISYNTDGVVMFQAEPAKPLMPFVTIHIAEHEKQSGFDGHSSLSEGGYDIAPFSYTDFFSQF